MEKAILVTGRLTGPRSVELDEPVAGVTGEVEVILRPRVNGSTEDQGVSQFLRSLPPGTRSRQDMDQQLREERTGWESAA
jgi:hypothetical protein